MNCPYCGKTFEDVIFMDSEEYDCKVYVSYEAHCPVCNCDWHWEDVYEYTETTVPHLIKINDHL